MDIEYLLESLHKSFYDKRFYDLAKNNPQELSKMISKYFRKQGLTFYINDYPYDNETFNFKDTHSTISAKDEKFIKDLGLDFNIVKKYNIGDMGKNIKKAIKNTFSPYSSLKNVETDKEYVDYFKKLDNNNKNQQLYNRLAKIKRSKINHSLNTETSKSFFSAESGRYNSNIKLPSLKIDENIVYITISTNSDFFEHGHDIKIKINNKEYNYKINLMDKFNKIMDKILKLVYKSIENPDDFDKPKKVERKYVENEILKIAKIYLGNWKKYTKTGKAKEAIPPIEYNIVIPSSKKTHSSYKTIANIQSFKLYYKVKARNIKSQEEKNSYDIPKRILDIYPEMPEWIDIMARYFNNNNKRFNINKILPNKIITDEHERYSKRIKAFIEKVGNLGYYPDSIRKEYIDRRNNKTYIIFKYNDKLKGNKEKIKQIIELDKTKEIIDNFSYGKGNFKIKDIPEKMIKYLFEI